MSGPSLLPPPHSAFDLLHYRGVDLARLAGLLPSLASFAPGILERLGVEGRYKQHILRQTQEVAAMARDENLLIADDIDYALLPGLSMEIRARLAEARPATLGQAKRLEGVTPASLVALMKHVRLGAAARAAVAEGL